jgi:hypothetical protein
MARASGVDHASVRFAPRFQLAADADGRGSSHDHPYTIGRLGKFLGSRRPLPPITSALQCYEIFWLVLL